MPTLRHLADRQKFTRFARFLKQKDATLGDVTEERLQRADVMTMPAAVWNDYLGIRRVIMAFEKDPNDPGAYADGYTALNSRWIDASRCADIPLDEAARSDEDKQRLADAYLSSFLPNRVTWLRYVPRTIREIARCPEETGGFWVPNGVEPPSWLLEALGKRLVTGLVLASGQLYFGAERPLHRLAAKHIEEVSRRVV